MKMKRLLPVLTALLLMVMSMPLFTVSAAKDPKLVVDMPDTIEPGKQLAVTVGIENNPGWSALQFAITYDTTQMELLDLERGEAMDDFYHIWFSYYENPAGTVNIIGLYNDSAPTVEESTNMEKDGTWFTLYFTAADSLKQGENVAVTVDMSTMVNAKLEQQMEPTVVKATAKVGTLSAEDNKTEPSKTKEGVVSGMVGTNPALTTTGANAVVDNPTAAAGDSGTTASGQAGQIVPQATNAEGSVNDEGSADAESPVFTPTGIVIAVLVVVALVAVILLIVFFSRRK